MMMIRNNGSSDRWWWWGAEGAWCRSGPVRSDTVHAGSKASCALTPDTIFLGSILMRHHVLVLSTPQFLTLEVSISSNTESSGQMAISGLLYGDNSKFSTGYLLTILTSKCRPSKAF